MIEQTEEITPWLYDRGRTEIFQKWMDSLEERNVERIRATVDKRSYNEEERLRG